MLVSTREDASSRRQPQPKAGYAFVVAAAHRQQRRAGKNCHLQGRSARGPDPRHPRAHRHALRGVPAEQAGGVRLSGGRAEHVCARIKDVCGFLPRAARRGRA
ncbi:hypothetical protein PG997_011523 [Apiospora hydei]|uniref:DUF397 domain-containing protein n=1 Tax=Apiospora hydei TaxID=1337664 RepID=A0ABR1VJA6_9PEZI